MSEPVKNKSGWRIVRCILVALAILATLVAFFYTEEDWRGRSDWENYKHDAEARGLVLDWEKFLPPSVPDDQNFYTASSNILLRFRQIPEGDTNGFAAARQSQWLKLDPFGTNDYNGHNRAPLFPTLDTSKSGPIVVAKIIVSPAARANLSSGTNIFSVTLDDANATDQIRNRIRDIFRNGAGRLISGVQGFTFSQFQLIDLPLVEIFVRASTPPSVETLNAFCPSDAVAGFGKLQAVATTDPNTFDILLTDARFTAAADYLKWSDQFVPAFDEIREALKRPYAILPGDYSAPNSMPIPNFVTMRALAQTLGQRAQCYLLLGQPDQALHELTLIHDVCRILTKPPTGQPETLVEAMINVAIIRLYDGIIADGLKQHQWQEPQLAALQQQLATINLPPHVYESFHEMAPVIVHNAETIPVQQWYSLVGNKPGWSTKLWLMPRGWVYQNIIVAVQLEQRLLTGFDLTDGIISPIKYDDSMGKVEKTLERPSPFHILAGITFPNFIKAWQTTAYGQTMVNEAQIACALERWRLAHGEYPDSLDSLTPTYLATIPQDIMNGGPLHYRRTLDGKFLLYSVGWNETDDGGEDSPHNKNGVTDYAKGDWAWQPK